MYAERGQVELAAQQYNAAIADADALTAVEPHNAVWLDYGARSRISFARMLLATGNTRLAAEHASVACQTYRELLSRPAPKSEWRKGWYGCAIVQSGLASAAGQKDQALAAAQQAITAARLAKTSDKVEDSFRLARAYRMVGDIQRDRGDLAAARTAWASGLAVIPNGIPEQPDEIAEHVAIMERLGRSAEAQPLNAKLNSMGYRLPV
jgi:tetratricopeptide (TPR) repeat protein